MAPKHIETTFIELRRKIGIIERIITHLHIMLRMEGHRGRLIRQTIITRIIVAVYTQLHLKHAEGAEIKKHIRVYRQRRKRDYVTVGCGLIGDGIVPVPYAEFQLLLQSQCENLHIAAVLSRERPVVEIYIILDIPESADTDVRVHGIVS